MSGHEVYTVKVDPGRASDSCYGQATTQIIMK